MPIRGEGDRAGQLRLRRHVASIGARHAAAEAGHAGAGLTAPGIQPLESGIGQARTGRHQIGRRAAIGAHHRIQRQHATIEQRGHAGTIERLELQHLPVILIHPAEVGARPVEPAAKACAVHEGQVRGVLLGREQALFGFGVQLALPFLPGRGEVEAEGGRGDCARFIGAAVAGTAPRAGNSRIRGRVYRNRTSGGVRTGGTSARLQNRPGRNACALGRTGSSLPRSPCGPFSRETTGTALSRRVAHAARAVSGKTSRSIPGHPGHSVPVHAARFMLHHATYGRRFGQNIASDGT